jgi:hypothetical protein
MDYGFSTPYRGMSVNPLPPGFMEFATAPGRNMAAGISKLGEGIGKFAENFDRVQKEKKAKVGLAKALRPFATQLGFASEEDYDLAGVDEKLGAATGAIQGKALQEQEQRLELGRRKAAEDERARTQQAAIPGFIAAFSGSSEADPAKRIAAAAKANPAALEGPGAAYLLQALAQFADQPGVFGSADMGTPKPVPGLNGTFFVPTSRNGGQLVDSGTAAAPEGKAPPGYALVPTGNGRVTPVRLHPEDSIAATKAADVVAGRYKRLQADLDAMEAKTSRGDEHWGPDALGLGTPRSTRVRQIRTEMSALEQANPWLRGPNQTATQAAPQQSAAQPSFGQFREGEVVKNKKDGKFYKIVNGKPVPQ